MDYLLIARDYSGVFSFVGCVFFIRAFSREQNMISVAHSAAGWLIEQFEHDSLRLRRLSLMLRHGLGRKL
jgi:hypothetical protein